MRTISYAIVFGVLIAAIATIARWLPLSYAPLISALVALHIGLSTKRKPLRAIFSAVLVGYIADLVQGTPPGVCALSAGVVAIMFYSVQGRLLVRGWLFSVVLGFVGASISGVVMSLVRQSVAAGPPVGGYLGTVFWASLTSAVFAPFVFAVCRRIDAKFVRTERERQLVLGGVLPL